MRLSLLRLCTRNAPLAAFGMLAAASLVTLPAPAQAGLFDFLFSGGVQRDPGPGVNSYAEPAPPVAPPPLGPQTVRRSDSGAGRALGFCVRLCDGRSFPLERMANATPVETCRAMCPTSQTKVFFGGEIDHAVAADGTHYAALDTAFVYRKQVIANCTCNGRDAFGLAPLDVANDPTLRPGDIVATQNGFVAYSGRRSGAASFTPVDAATLTKGLDSVTAPRRDASRPSAPETVDDDPGTIVPSPPSPLHVSDQLRR